jgi:hypothetical protein
MAGSTDTYHGPTEILESANILAKEELENGIEW